MKNIIPVKFRARSSGIMVLSTAVAAASCLLGLGDAATASVAASFARAASWPSQVAHPASASCPRGEMMVAPTTGWTDALGVAHFRYKAAPGLVTNIPPRGLTANRVTRAIITDSGLPTGRPAGARPARRLVQQVLNLGEHQRAPAFCRSRAKPDDVITAGRSRRPRASQPGLRNSHVGSGNWGGYAVTEAENGGHGINGADGSWTVGRSSTSSAPSAESTWVGVGGGLPNGSVAWGLIQVGVSMQTNEGYRSWWEYIGSSGCSGSNRCAAHYKPVDSAGPGDSVTGEAWWNSSTSACFYLTDWTHSGATFSTCQSGLTIPYDHTSAEWINENFIQQASIYYDNPGTINWTDQSMTNTLGGNGGWRSPFSGSFEAVIMGPGHNPSGTSCGNGNVLSYPANAATESSGGSSKIITCSISGIDSP